MAFEGIEDLLVLEELQKNLLSKYDEAREGMLKDVFMERSEVDSMNLELRSVIPHAIYEMKKGRFTMTFSELIDVCLYSLAQMEGIMIRHERRTRNPYMYDRKKVLLTV